MGALVLALQIAGSFTFKDKPPLGWVIGAVGLIFLIAGVWIGIKQVQTSRQREMKRKTGNPSAFGLSEREMEVLVLLSQGLSNREVADKLFVSTNTIKTHISNIYSKLSAQRRTQAIQKAREYELI